MIKILSPYDYDNFIKSKEYNKMLKFSLLENKRIGWNYPLDYSFIIESINELDIAKDAKKIVDIGCGPGAIHGYLENKYEKKITGVDLNRWEKDYVDFNGDFNNVDFRRENNLNNIDLVISSSAIEHNSPRNHLKLLNSIFSSLSPNGIAIITFSISTKKFNSKYYNQINLSSNVIEKFYNDQIININSIKEIKKAYLNTSYLSEAYFKRYKSSISKLNYLSIGAIIRPNDFYSKRKKTKYFDFFYVP